MSIHAIKHAMEKLVNVHGDLLEISKQKTVFVKEGSIEKLQEMLIKERQFIQVLDQAEANRRKVVDAWFSERKLPLEDATITNILGIIQEEHEKVELEKVAVALTESIVRLKQQEQLNQALIQQSMQFVQLSLDMINPTIKNMNYNNKHEAKSVKRSVFDSKA